MEFHKSEQQLLNTEDLVRVEAEENFNKRIVDIDFSSYNKEEKDDITTKFWRNKITEAFDLDHFHLIDQDKELVHQIKKIINEDIHHMTPAEINHKIQEIKKKNTRINNLFHDFKSRNNLYNITHWWEGLKKKKSVLIKANNQGKEGNIEEPKRNQGKELCMEYQNLLDENETFDNDKFGINSRVIHLLKEGDQIKKIQFRPKSNIFAAICKNKTDKSEQNLDLLIYNPVVEDFVQSKSLEKINHTNRISCFNWIPNSKDLCFGTRTGKIYRLNENDIKDIKEDKINDLDPYSYKVFPSESIEDFEGRPILSIVYSPNGNYVAYAKDETKDVSLHLIQQTELFQDLRLSYAKINTQFKIDPIPLKNECRNRIQIYWLDNYTIVFSYRLFKEQYGVWYFENIAAPKYQFFTLKKTEYNINKSTNLNLCANPKKKMIAVALGNEIHLINILIINEEIAPKEITILRKHQKNINSICFSSCGKKLCSASEDTILIWGVLNFLALAKLKCKKNEKILTIHWTDNQNIIASANTDIKLWENCVGKFAPIKIENDGYENIKENMDNDLNAVAFFKDKICFSTGQGKLEFLEKTNEKWNRRCLLKNEFDVTYFCIENDTRVKKIKKKTFSNNHINITSIIFNHDGKKICFSTVVRKGLSGKDIDIFIYNLKNEEIIDLQDATENKETKFTELVRALAWSFDERILCAGSICKKLRIYHFDKNLNIERIENIANSSKILTMDIDINSYNLVIGGNENEIKVFDTINSLVLGKMTGHHKRVWKVKYNPDGIKIISCGGDNMIKMWNGYMFTMLFSMDCVDIYNIDWSPDGSKICATYSNKMIIISILNKKINYELSICENKTENALLNLAWISPDLIFYTENNTISEFKVRHSSFYELLDFKADLHSLLKGNLSDQDICWLLYYNNFPHSLSIFHIIVFLDLISNKRYTHKFFKILYDRDLHVNVFANKKIIHTPIDDAIQKQDVLSEFMKYIVNNKDKLDTFSPFSYSLLENIKIFCKLKFGTTTKSLLDCCIKEYIPPLEVNTHLKITSETDEFITFNEVLDINNPKFYEEISDEQDKQKLEESSVTAKVYWYIIDLPNVLKVKDEHGFLKNIAALEEENTIYSSLALEKIVEYKWNKYAKAIYYFEFLIYLCYIVIFLVDFLYCFPTRLNETNKNNIDRNKRNSIALGIVLIVFNVHFIQKEIIQIWHLGKNIYNNYLNYFDWIIIFLFFAIVILDFCHATNRIDSGTKEVRALQSIISFYIFFMTIRIFSFLRGFSQTTFLVTLILQVLYDIRFFIVVMILFMGSFTYSAFILQSVGNFADRWPVFKAVYSLTLGDFEKYNSVSSVEAEVTFIIFLLATVLVTIVLLNLLIAILGDSFEKVVSRERSARIYERVQIICEIDYTLDKIPLFVILNELIETFIYKGEKIKDIKKYLMIRTCNEYFLEDVEFEEGERIRSVINEISLNVENTLKIFEKMMPEIKKISRFCSEYKGN